METKLQEELNQIISGFSQCWDESVYDEYITVTNINALNKMLFCTNAFGLKTKFKFDEFVDIK